MDKLLTINGIDYIKKDEFVDAAMIKEGLNKGSIRLGTLVGILEDELTKNISDCCLCHDEINELGNYETIDKVVLLSLLKTIRV